MVKPEVRFSIENGPGKFDLMMALFDSNNAHPRRVSFSIRPMAGTPPPWLTGRNLVEADIVSVEREDGSGESWNLKGHLHLPSTDCSADFKAYFSTRSRRGTLAIVDR